MTHHTLARLRMGGALLALALLAFHALMTIVYLSPPNLLKMKLARVNATYMGQLFYQDWHLFSPNPGISTTRLWIRCETSAGWSNWIEPMEQVQNDYYSNRISGKGKVLYVYHGIAALLSEAYDEVLSVCLREHGESCNREEVMSQVEDTGRYRLAHRFARQVCQLKEPATIAVKFKIMTLRPKRFSERKKPGKWGSVTEIEFSPVLTAPTPQEPT